MARLRQWLILVLAVALLGLPAAGAAATDAPPKVPLLVGIRAAHQPGYDRVVFDFRGGLPDDVQVTRVKQLIADGSGLPVPVAGRAFLQVRFEPAQAHDDAGRATAPARVAFALPNAITAVRTGDFEAVTTYGIGLAKEQPYSVFTLTRPDRVVVDVRTDFPTTWKQVWFFDERRFVANREPFFVPVTRPVLPGTPATGVMDHLFAGPTPREHAAGLRLLNSRATGFTRLRIADGIARVQLTGGCSSGGSTVSIAGSILPTMRQFPTVDFVKVYDPAGTTGSPTGRSDSIPECLEP